MDDVDVLESILTKDVLLVEAVAPTQLARPTRCPQWDVTALLDHMTGWLQVFAAGAEGRLHKGDADAFTTEDPAGDFRAAAAETVTGWRTGGVERMVRFTGAELPGQMVLSMALMEYVAHGCDLAAATGQVVPFGDAELALALARGEETLPAEYRGPGKPFGDRIEVSASAPVLDRFLGFLGRQP